MDRTSLEELARFYNQSLKRRRIGAGSILVAPVNIGQEAVIGANAVVTRNQDVADGQTVVGVPARPIKPSQRQG